MLFLLVMEMLNALIRKAEEWSLFQLLGVHAIPHLTPMYTDDLIMFLSLVASDLQMARNIFTLLV
jgi:hypothetical protein